MVAPIVAVAWLAFVRRWTFDDGFIYFRVVDQLIAGNGPVFNAGERVESFTSPAWLAVLVAADLLSPVRLEYTAAALSIASTTIGMALATAASARLAIVPHGTTRKRVRVPLGLAIFASLWPVWIWGTSGMEVGLTYLWLGSCFFVLVCWAVRHRRQDPEETFPSSHLVLLGAGALIRPELLLSSIGFVATVTLMTARARRGRVRMIATAAALPLAYQVFRMGYYGLLVSSPAIAKEGARIRLSRGWSYLVDFVEPYVLVFPLVLAVGLIGVAAVRRFAAARQTRAVAATLAVSGSGLVHAGYIVAVGGDYVHARLLLPALFAFLAPVFVVTTSRSTLWAAVLVFGWVPVAALFLRPSYDEDRDGDPGFTSGYFGTLLTYQDRGFEHRGAQPWMNGPGLYVAFPFAPGGLQTGIRLDDSRQIAVASRAIGVNGYVMGPDIRVIDLYGLADPLIGHFDAIEGRLPGHEKPADESWLIAAVAGDPGAVSPSDLVLSNPDTRPAPPLVTLDAIAWAEGALLCDELVRLEGSVSAPLTLHRLLSNVLNSPRNTVLRVDRDPVAAYRELCGGGTPPQVVALRARYRRVDGLALRSERGELAVIDDCRFVFFGTADSTAPWEPIHVSGYALLVSIDPDTRAGVVQLFSLGSYAGVHGRIGIQFDGLGWYRVRQDIEWFPPRLQEWTPIPESGSIELTLSVDFDDQTWSTAIGDEEVSALPLLSPPDGRFRPIRPRFADHDPTSAVNVTVDAESPSNSCRDALRNRTD